MTVDIYLQLEKKSSINYIKYISKTLNIKKLHYINLYTYMQTSFMVASLLYDLYNTMLTKVCTYIAKYKKIYGIHTK